MSFLHLSLLFGLASMGVPILLHLLGQRQPKLEIFPALRFVKQTIRHRRSSWQLKHLLLLLLRILLVAGLAFALARPRIHSAMLSTILGVSTISIAAALASLVAAVAWVTRRPKSISIISLLIALSLWLLAGAWGGWALTRGPIVPQADQSAPVAAVIIVDCGPSMAYRANNQMRLDAAREMAIWILDQLPIDSRVGVFAGVRSGALSLDPASAKAQIQNLSLRGSHIDLPGQIETAVRLLTASELERKEVYVITDLSASSWSQVPTGLKEQLMQRANEILVQIIDLGAEPISNWRLGDVEFDTQFIPEGSDVNFEVELTRSDAATPGTATVELVQEALDPRLPILSNGKLELPPSKPVDERVVDLSTERSVRVNLSAKHLPAGTHNFQIRVDKPDPLESDNIRYATVVSQPPQPVLVVADDPDAASYYVSLVDPRDALQRGSAPRICDQIRYSQLGLAKLDQYAALCLIDPPLLAASTVERLNERIEKGAGLLLVLGPQLSTSENLANSPVAKLLPGTLGGIIDRPRADRNLFLVPIATAHPLFYLFGATTNEIPWYRHPVFRFWEFKTLNERAQILMVYNDKSAPAVILETRGQGQVITITTLLPEWDSLERLIWNELTIGEDTWPAFGLLYGAVQTLSGNPQAKLTYAVGQTATLENNSQVWPSRYELYTPAAHMKRLEAADGILVIGELDQPGVYRLRPLRTDPGARAVSANIPSADTVLARLSQAELDEMLGAGMYRLARDRNEVTSSVGQARFGQELYPWLMVLIAGIFLAEQAMSNRFYKLNLPAAGAGG